MTAHGGPPVLIWFWLILGGLGIGVPAAVIIAALMLRARASRSALRATAQPFGPAKAHISRVTRCGLAGLGVGALMGVALIAAGRGGLAALGCAGGYLGGLLVGEYSGQPPARDKVRSARLMARRPTDYLPHWAAVTALLSAALVAGAPLAFALAPTVRYGNWRPVSGAAFTLPGGHTSWPAVFPGTAAAAVLALAVLGIGAAGLRRIAARPGTADHEAATVDEELRRQAGRAMVGAVLGFELMTLGALLIASSDGLAVPVPSVAPGAYLGSRIMVVAGLCCAGAGLAGWLLLSGWTRRLRRAGPPPGPAPVTPGT